MAEKRRFTRFKVSLRAKFTPQDSVHEYDVIGENISMGGVKIALDKNIEVAPGTEMALQLYLPKVVLDLKGKVAWIEEKGKKKELGVKFLQLPDYYKQDIYDYISRYNREQLTSRWWQF
ncbi:MAG: PilZ domain-containing protein [Candidatus Omnitrophota bacterium]|nr:MAG: PilZ domain-containing protein [Candidatus Omnitrophota bacterium]